jgi:uncharacterized protein (TIGR00299 family) protein
MNIAFFDIISGISGDMTLGAFVSAGMSLDVLHAELEKLPLGGYSISQRSMTRSMITAVKVDVELHGASPGGGHHHHGNGHHAEHRSYADIVRLIDESTLSDHVREQAKAMFLTIAKAEAKIHDTSVESVHFHEVGAVDSIVDIVGIAICMEHLGIDAVYSSPVRTGSGGFVETQHGTMPVPTPATMEILRGYPVELTDVPFELTTPTGASVIRTLSKGVLKSTDILRVKSIGYGAGSKEIPGMPNLLRVMIAELPEDFEDEEIVLLETNIDDMNTELYPFVLERVLEEGAHDAWMTQVIMKKGRPGHLLSVLSPLRSVEHLLGVLYTETSTTGIRVSDIRRRKLQRDTVIAETSFGPVEIKEIHAPGGIRRVPEHESCRRIAKEAGIPLIDVYRTIERELSD